MQRHQQRVSLSALSNDIGQRIRTTLLPEVSFPWDDGDGGRLNGAYFELATHTLCPRYHQPRDNLLRDGDRMRQQEDLHDLWVASFRLELGNDGDNARSEHVNRNYERVANDRADSCATGSDSTQVSQNDNVRSEVIERYAGPMDLEMVKAMKRRGDS